MKNTETSLGKKVIDTLKERLEDLPVWIRRLCNDCPSNRRWLRDDGSQNVFVEGLEQVMDGEFTITLIDQAHPILSLRAFHSFAQFMINASSGTIQSSRSNLMSDVGEVA